MIRRLLLWLLKFTEGYPKNCELCEKRIESKDDLDWHGLGNCVPICMHCMGSGIEDESKVPLPEVRRRLGLAENENPSAPANLVLPKPVKIPKP